MNNVVFKDDPKNDEEKLLCSCCNKRFSIKLTPRNQTENILCDFCDPDSRVYTIAGSGIVITKRKYIPEMLIDGMKEVFGDYNVYDRTWDKKYKELKKDD